jgi:mono/diheme cytochrome c family protein
MSAGRVRLVLLAACATISLTGCQLKDDGDNLVNGKALFAEQCARCHQLARANAQGVVGPSLDEAWQQSEKDGLGRSTYKGVVHKQILEPNRRAQVDPATGKSLEAMPAKLVTGEDAQDVAAYVAYAAARPGKDSGRLAQAGQQQSDAVAKAKGGTLDIPAAPSGALAYEFGSAEASAGPLTINSVNASSVDHDISLEGAGIDEQGEVVKDGGTSTVRATVKPGEYTFYCSVPGHREGGM